MSVPLFLEYEDVLLRPGVLPAHMPPNAVSAFLDAFLSVAESRETHFRFRPWLPDPGDEFVLELAFAAGNVPIVTHNTRDFDPASRLGIRIVTPAQIVDEINLP